MTTALHPLADEYMTRLEREAQRLPRAERDELLAEIRSHLDHGVADGASEADVRNLLAELGSPEDIVAAAGPEKRPTRRGLREVFALLLLVTGFPPVIGWLIGVALLWWSPLWTTRQKVLGMLIWPGGWTVAGGAVGLMSGPSLLSIAAIIIVLLGPLVVAAYLYAVAGVRSETA